MSYHIYLACSACYVGHMQLSTWALRWPRCSSHRLYLSNSSLLVHYRPAKYTNNYSFPYSFVSNWIRIPRLNESQVRFVLDKFTFEIYYSSGDIRVRHAYQEIPRLKAIQRKTGHSENFQRYTSGAGRFCYTPFRPRFLGIDAKPRAPNCGIVPICCIHPVRAKPRAPKDGAIQRQRKTSQHV